MLTKGRIKATSILLVLVFLFSIGAAVYGVSTGTTQKINESTLDVQCPTGSITVCKMIIDSNKNIITGSGASANFSINLTKPSGQSIAINFSAPLVFDTEIISDDENDAQCYHISNLPLGTYQYNRESILTNSWGMPKYNDQHTSPVNDINDFFAYGASTNSDGSIELTNDRPIRTLVVLNQYNLPYCAPRTIGYWKQPCKDHFNHENEASLLSYLAEVHNMTDFFDSITTFNDICNILDLSEPAEMSQRAKQQMLALWFNVVSSKIFLGTQVNLGAISNATTVGDALSQAESLFGSNPEKSKTIADTINNGGSVITACVPSVCGNDILENGEQCDGTAGIGPHQACTADCKLRNLTYCGDGIKQTPNDEEIFEQCDKSDGTPVNYTCLANCTLVKTPYCEIIFNKTSMPDPVSPGGKLNYTIQLKNIGTGNCTGGGVQVKEYYDNRTSFVSATPPPTSGNNLWNFGVVQPGQIREINITVKVSDCVQDCSTLTNKACFWAAEYNSWNCIFEYTNTTCPHEFCGDGFVQAGEQCELPDTTSNTYCDQTTQQCESDGKRFGTRDTYGSCNSICGCIETPFDYRCIAGQCDAACDDGNDFSHAGGICYYGCDADETCSFTSSCPTSSYCGGFNNNTYFFNGQCSGLGCSLNEDNCDNHDYYENASLFCSGNLSSHVKFHDFTCSANGCNETIKFVNESVVQNCNALDGWYDTGPIQWVSDSQCMEKKQKEQEYRNYSCGLNATCEYIVNSIRWADTGATRNVADGTSCDDGLFCTTEDVCTAGICSGTPLTCPGDQCNAGYCNEDSDSCDLAPLPSNTTCEFDENLCTIDFCNGFGSCTNRDNVVCPLPDVCEDTNTCNPLTGMCEITFSANDTLCNDNIFCNGQDRCDGTGACINAGPPVNCISTNPCLFGTCSEEQKKCIFLPGNDNETPSTMKTYGLPYYSNGTSEWISSTTLIELNTTDNPIICPNNFTTFYRITLVDKSNCENNALCQITPGDGSWNIYSGLFHVGETSCHMIEFYANDTSGNAEQKHKQCAFVNNEGPTPVKTVGDPKMLWEGDNTFYPNLTEICNKEGGIDCWKISLSTPITLDCTGAQPHPVGQNSACFIVGLDGDDATDSYCTKLYGDMQDGYCCIETPFTFNFFEESQHNLAFYCKDKIGNMGVVDDEKFKVEGNSFNITINKKWNLISVPFALMDDNPETVFKDIRGYIIDVWTYDPEHEMCGQDWCIWTPGSPSNLKIWAGWGYWVLANNDTTLLIGGSLLNPDATPPSKNLVAGWNLIGYYGNEDSHGNQLFSFDGSLGKGKDALCELGSLIDTGFGNPRWNSLVTYWEPDNPNQWKAIDYSGKMDPGAGYWIEMDAADLYSPSTTCPES